MNDDNLLYHYCSNDSFCSIVKNHSVWLSSLSLSNDTMEGLGFCLSEEGDLLSQWRGYADNASGVSIGFSKEYLRKLADNSRSETRSGFTLQQVEYEDSNQIEKIKPTYLKIKDLIDKGAFKTLSLKGLLDFRSDEEIEKENSEIQEMYKKLSMTVLMLFAELFLLKSKAFSEEREWRLITYFVKVIEDECLFRANGDRIVPYREYELIEFEPTSIAEVILGPKNITPNYVVENFMSQNGFDNTKILRSVASYR